MTQKESRGNWQVFFFSFSRTPCHCLDPVVFSSDCFCFTRAGPLVGWLVGGSVGWLAGWLAGWLVGWLPASSASPASLGPGTLADWSVICWLADIHTFVNTYIHAWLHRCIPIDKRTHPQIPRSPTPGSDRLGHGRWCWLCGCLSGSHLVS